jgi:hypothetical protein
MSYSDDIRAQVAAGKSRDEIITAICKARKIPRDNARSAYNKAIKTGGAPSATAKQTKPATAPAKRSDIFLSDGDIAARHDCYYKIRTEAKRLKKGQYVEDGNFRDMVLQMSTAEYRRPSDNAEFDIYKGKAGGKTYWGHPESIKAKKQEGIMR